jgi:hypothetical protein
MTRKSFENGRRGEDAPAREKVRSCKRPYEAPRILSDEPLEVAAGVCGLAGIKGKSAFPTCTTHGS